MEKNKKLSATFAAAVLGAAALVTIAGGANAATQVDAPAVAVVDTYVDDGPNVGPDTDLTEAGHQDLDDPTEPETPEADDGPNVGPDTDLTQAGHQDLDDPTEPDTASK